MQYKLGTIFFMFILAYFITPQHETKIESKDSNNAVKQDTIPIALKCDSLMRENHKTVQQLKRNTEKLKKINEQ